jgi:hypothetical protein
VFIHSPIAYYFNIDFMRNGYEAFSLSSGEKVFPIGYEKRIVWLMRSIGLTMLVGMNRAVSARSLLIITTFSPMSSIKPVVTVG